MKQNKTESKKKKKKTHKFIECITKLSIPRQFFVIHYYA